jgi:hypothetical protein
VGLQNFKVFESTTGRDDISETSVMRVIHRLVYGLVCTQSSRVASVSGQPLVNHEPNNLYPCGQQHGVDVPIIITSSTRPSIPDSYCTLSSHASRSRQIPDAKEGQRLAAMTAGLSSPCLGNSMSSMGNPGTLFGGVT